MMCFYDVFPFSLHRIQEFCERYFNPTTQLAISCSKLTVETLKQGMKYVQS